MADGTRPKISTRRALWTTLSFSFRADPWRAALALISSSLSAIASGLSPVFLAHVIDAIVSHDSATLQAWVIGFGVCTAVALALGMLRLDLRFRLEESATILVEQRIIELTTSIPGLEHHERPELLDELELLREQRGQMAGSVSALVENTVVFSRVATTLGVLASLDPVLLLLPVMGFPSLIAAGVVRSAWKRSEERLAEQRRLGQHYFDLSLSSPAAKELRVFGLRREILRRHVDLYADVQHAIDRTARWTSAVSMGGWLVFALGYVGALSFVATRVVNGEAGPGDMVLVVSAAASVNENVSSFFWMVGWLFDTLKTVGRYLRLVALAEDAAAIPHPAEAPDRLREGIRLESVDFRYPGTDRPILHGVDLHLPAGSTVAVVGENGAGKSTLMKLLCQFYRPTAGSITVDGIDLDDIDPVEWRQRVSAGFQDFARYELVAAETVGVGWLDHLDDRPWIEHAVERAAAEDVTPSLPDGLDSMVGKRFEGGTELSGGQWQKLALARAMIRDRPLLLVLDEPTAALDADTEHELFERYREAAAQVAAETGAITVLVSHRFSTVRNADLVVVVDEGGIAECGTHDELMATGGTYAELFELQARAYR